MDKAKLIKRITRVEQQTKHFKQKSTLDTLSYSEDIIGRERKTEELVNYLLGFKQGLVVPLISVYGRSGSGKSTITRFVCHNMDEISYCFVNLRKAKTVFGVANLILSELGRSSLKNSQGTNLATYRIEKAIVTKLEQEKKKFFVMILDEFDMLFSDKRGRPSDFIYKLLAIEEFLKTKGFMMTIICISNNVLSSYELDDRVKSRIGSSEIFFEPYSHDDVVEILQSRARKAISAKVSISVLRYCAEISSLGHGDARRAIDLLRVAAEIASQKHQPISNSHIDLASDELQKDRVKKILESGSYHFKSVCLSLARVTYLTGRDWHATSSIFKQFSLILSKDERALTHRRVSDLLVELENTGLVISETRSRGRQGYGTSYKLTVMPELVGDIIGEEWWKSIVELKKKHEEYLQSPAYTHPDRDDPKEYWEKGEHDKKWAQYVGL